MFIDMRPLLCWRKGGAPFQQKVENGKKAQGVIDGNYHCNRRRYAVSYKIPLREAPFPHGKIGVQFHEPPREIKERLFLQSIAMTGKMRYN